MTAEKFFAQWTEGFAQKALRPELRRWAVIFARFLGGSLLTPMRSRYLFELRQGQPDHARPSFPRVTAT
jgi:hypothetical protein